jgi:hypothetical protein
MGKISHERSLDPALKTPIQLLALSVVLGAGWGVSQLYTNSLLQPLVVPQFGPSILRQVVALAVPVLEYL